MMATLALVLFVAYLLIGFGLRSWLQLRATGDTGFRGVSGHLGSSEWWAGVLFVAALAAGLTGPIAGLLGLSPIGQIDSPPLVGVGAMVGVLGIVLTFLAQTAMGTSWRIGVADDDHTELVTKGLFHYVRNPMFTATAVTGLGLTLMVPNVVALSGLVMLVLALQLQVRVVEEPFLLREHGTDYASYASRTGRFLPGVGRLAVLHDVEQMRTR